MTEEGEP